MAKEFNPDEFLQETAPIAESQADIERKNAEREAAGQAQSQGAMPGQGPVSPSMLDQAGNFITQTAIPTAYGVGAAAANVAASHPYLTAGAAAMLPNSVLNKIPGGQKIAAVKDIASNLGRAAEAYAAKEARIGSGGAYGRTPVGTPGSPIGAQPMPAQPMAQQPGIIQRGMDVASRMRNVAAQRVIGFGASGAAVPAAVAAIPGAMMMDAYGNYKQQTPEERKQSAMDALSGQGMGQAGIY